MWDRQVPGCFGDTDLIFAGHPNDEARAFAWLTDLRQRSIGWAETRGQIEEYLKSRNASQAHIQRQTAKAEAAMRFWLLD